LLSILNDTTADRLLRRTAAEALGKLKSQHAKDALLRAYNGKDVEVAAGAATALKAIGYSPALEPLLADLKLDNVVRRKALATLAAFGDTRAVKPLIAYIEDPENTLIREAVDALKSIDPQAAQNTIDRLCAKSHAFGPWRSVMPQFKQDNRYVHTGERVCQRCGTKEVCSKHDFGPWAGSSERARTCRRCGYRDVDVRM
jgi:HEAT repeat protein